MAAPTTSMIRWSPWETSLPQLPIAAFFFIIILLFVLKKFIVGDALDYQKNPAKFLLHKSCSSGSSIFDINLAGRNMTVMTGTCHDDACASSKSSCPHRELLKQAMTLPERILSARDAVADVGFLYTLGANNVYRGTDFHKRCIKDYMNENGDFNGGLLNALRESYRVVIEAERFKQQQAGDNSISVDDLLNLVRLATLRAIVVELLGGSFLRCSICTNNFLDEFMILQDSIEAATAAAAVLPAWISVPLILKPVERRRKKLQKDIQERIRWAWQQDYGEIGPWLLKFRQQCDDGSLTLEVASEFVVGLLFAAAKNPAIASAQTLLFLILLGTDEHKSKVQTEAEQLAISSHSSSQPKRDTSTMPMSALRQSCYETLRLTSHSIGALRKVKEEVVLGSGTSHAYKLCPRQVVAVSHIVPSLDQRLWGKDADKYIPSREEWTVERARPDEYKFSTFSQGHHRCPGQSLALQIMELTISILLVDYEVTLQQKKEMVPGVCFERATIAQRKGNVPIYIRSR